MGELSPIIIEVLSEMDGDMEMEMREHGSTPTDKVSRWTAPAGTRAAAPFAHDEYLHPPRPISPSCLSTSSYFYYSLCRLTANLLANKI